MTVSIEPDAEVVWPVKDFVRRNCSWAKATFVHGTFVLFVRNDGRNVRNVARLGLFNHSDDNFDVGCVRI